MEFAEAPFSDPESVRIIVLVLFTILGAWAVLVLGGSFAGYRAGRDGTRGRAFVVWVVSVTLQVIVALVALAAAGVDAVTWVVPPLLLTVMTHVIGRLAGTPARPDAVGPESEGPGDARR